MKQEENIIFYQDAISELLKRPAIRIARLCLSITIMMTFAIQTYQILDLGKNALFLIPLFGVIYFFMILIMHIYPRFWGRYYLVKQDGFSVYNQKKELIKSYSWNELSDFYFRETKMLNYYLLRFNKNKYKVEYNSDFFDTMSAYAPKEIIENRENRSRKLQKQYDIFAIILGLAAMIFLLFLNSIV